MRKVLYIFGQLNDIDIEWLIQTGKRQELLKGTILIKEGQASDYLYIVLEGSLAVSNRSLGQIASLGVGEMVGEMSFIDASPPSATLQAVSNIVVFTLPREAINQKIKNDTAFAARFYRAIAMFLSDRIRSLNTVQARDHDPYAESLENDELDLNVLDNVYLAGQRFDRILKRMLEK